MSAFISSLLEIDAIDIDQNLVMTVKIMPMSLYFVQMLMDGHIL